MIQVATEWNPLQARLKENILNPDVFPETIRLLSHMHSLLHTLSVYGLEAVTYMDRVWKDMDDKTFRTMPTVKDVTVAWAIWHITRIEDLTVNILIARDNQVLNQSWLQRLNTSVKDTANAMSDPEIIAFSRKIDRDELVNYRNAVGNRTREVIAQLRPEDMKRKVEKRDLSRILNEGGVIPHKDSIWLLDFWGKKSVAGLLLMPVTRHQIVHLNECFKLKGKYRRMMD